MWLVVIVLESTILVERAITRHQSSVLVQTQWLTFCVSLGEVPCLSGLRFAQLCYQRIQLDH